MNTDWSAVIYDIVKTDTGQNIATYVGLSQKDFKCNWYVYWDQEEINFQRLLFECSKIRNTTNISIFNSLLVERYFDIYTNLQFHDKEKVIFEINMQKNTQLFINIFFLSRDLLLRRRYSLPLDPTMIQGMPSIPWRGSQDWRGVLSDRRLSGSILSHISRKLQVS